MNPLNILIAFDEFEISMDDAENEWNWDLPPIEEVLEFLGTASIDQ
jgi:hypothetical protein|tara:strand:- start:45 stop:182 length:138 start_codon:yes stop_codon:yes gene_type:complete